MCGLRPGPQISPLVAPDGTSAAVAAIPASMPATPKPGALSTPFTKLVQAVCAVLAAAVALANAVCALMSRAAACFASVSALVSAALAVIQAASACRRAASAVAQSGMIPLQFCV